MVDKADIENNIPSTNDVIQVATGEKVTAEIENQNNLLVINSIILAYNWIIDSGVELTVENIFTAAQAFSAGLKAGQIDPLTTNGNIILNVGSGGVYNSSVAVNNKYLTSAEVAALITTGSDVVDRDYGDITVSASGQTWTIDANAVTQSKIGFTFSTITSNTTAVNNGYYLCDTSAGAFTLTFPATASAGHKIYVCDLEGTFSTNNLTIGRNGLNIENQATDLVLDIKNFTGLYYYVDATIGWKRI